MSASSALGWWSDLKYVVCDAETKMPRKRYTPEEIVAKLRQIDALVSQGQSIIDAIRQSGISEMMFYRWRRQSGEFDADQAKRLAELELENNRLREAIWDLTLHRLNLTEATKGHFLSAARRRALGRVH
jgi:transposase-like protein